MGKQKKARQTGRRRKPVLRPCPSTHAVKSTSASDIHRTLILRAGSTKTIRLQVHRFALVGERDKIVADSTNGGHLSILSSENPDDLIPVVPHFERTRALRLGSHEYQLRIKEITTQQDLTEYQYLEGFHYKTSSAIVTEDNEPQKDNLSAGGRKAVLLVYLVQGKRMLPAGYLELQMPLLMVKPRHVLFAKGFRHPTRNVAWTTWNADTIRKYVNLIVRIARVVISPDLRGLGLARTLIETAKEYATDRWHVNGYRPLFLEISAEMLKYMDFVTPAGLHYIGDTEGNLARVHKDLVYMQKGYDISSGIMSLQKKYLTKLQQLATEHGKSFKDVLTRLKELTAHSRDEQLRKELNALGPQEWYLYKTALRFPLPYFMCGLDEPTEDFLTSQSTATLAPHMVNKPAIPPARICLRDIQVTSCYDIPDSVYVRAIRDCFGLDGSVLRVSLLGPVSVEASGGNIILITGPSGSGKSILLRLLDPAHNEKNLRVAFRDGSGRAYQAAWLRDIQSDKPLIQYFSEQWGMESSIAALNRAGLSEAFLYLRPYGLLSRGQQYRARLAALSLGTAPVWLMDEFCADLDPFTARIVASNLRKHVITTSRVAIVAAANTAHYVDALKPTRVIYLRHNGKSEHLTYKEYIDEFCIRPL